MVCMRKVFCWDSFTKSPEEWLPLPKLAERKPSVDCGGFDKKSNIRFSDKILQSVQNYKSWTRIFVWGNCSIFKVGNTMMCMISKNQTWIILITITRSKLYPNSDKHENEHQLFVGGPHCVSQSLKPPGMSGTAHDHNTQDKNNIVYEQICAYENVVTWPF